MNSSSDGRLATLRYLSLGAGVQSTTMLIMSDRGLRGIPRADCAIFADTGAEPAWVYRTLESLQKSVDIPIHVVSAGRKIDDLESSTTSHDFMITAPVYAVSIDDGSTIMTRRQCTYQYKIEPIERKVRELMGYDKGERIGKGTTACAMIGISLDEVRRMKTNRTPWIENTWPLVDLRMTRRDCIKLLEELGIPRPYKSSCYFCPFHGNEYWQTLKTQFPVEWARAVAYDKAIRDYKADGFDGQRFIHRSCVPLDEIDFTHGGQGTFDFWDMECEGMCGV